VADVFVRREVPGDVAAVRAIVCAAFAQDESEPVEAGLLDELRLCDGWIPELSVVATIDDVVVGHVICTRGRVGSVDAVGLGPIAVAPDLQHKGIGSALMHWVLGAADARGEPFVALLGSPDYYSRFGFAPSTEHGIDPPDPAWGPYFQTRTLSSFTGATGSFEYAEPFNNL
jgi:putative acetyltransferase